MTEPKRMTPSLDQWKDQTPEDVWRELERLRAANANLASVAASQRGMIETHAAAIQAQGEVIKALVEALETMRRLVVFDTIWTDEEWRAVARKALAVVDQLRVSESLP